MKKNLFIFAVAIAAAVSCQDEIASPEIDSANDGTFTITASVGTETKTTLGENGLSSFWAADDRISVFDSKKDANNRCFSIEADQDATFPATTATFSSSEEFTWPDNGQTDPLIVALYPYQENAYCDFFYYDRNYITGIEIPAEQKALAGGFDPAATFALATGKLSTKDDLTFNNLYTLLKVSVAEEGVEKITVTFGEGEYVAGEARVQLKLETVNDAPVFNGGVLSAAGSNSVTLTCQGGFDTEETYYIAIAPVTYTSISVALDDEVVKSATADSKTLLANHIYNILDLEIPLKERNLAFSKTEVVVTYAADLDVEEPALNGNDDETVTYTSSDEEVATVDAATGAVTVIKAGQTTITATVAETDTHEAASAEYTLTVNKAARNLSFSSTTASATLGQTFSAPVLSGVKDGETVTYTSSETSVATINNEGVVTLVDAGETTITATVAEDDKYLEGKATYTLTIEYAKSAWSVQIGDTKTPTYIIGNYYVAKGVSLTASSSFILVNNSNVKIRGIADKSPVNKWCYLYKSSGDPNMTGVETAGNYDLYIDPAKHAYILVTAGQSMPAFSYENQALYFVYENKDWKGLYGWTSEPDNEFLGYWDDCSNNAGGTFKTHDNKECSYWLIPSEYYNKKIYVIVRYINGNDKYQSHDTELNLTGDQGAYRSGNSDYKDEVGLYDFDDDKGYKFQ